MATIEEIKELRDVLERASGGRNSSYDDVIRFYTGGDLRTTKRQGFFSGITSAISSIFTPRDEDEDLDLVTPINIIKPAIDNKVAFLSMPPDIRVHEPPDMMAPQNPAVATAGPSGLTGGGATQLGGAPGSPPTPPAGAPPTLPGEMPQLPGQELELPNSPVGAPAQPSMVENEDWAASFADREEKAILSLLDASNMPRRCRDLAWSVSAMGGAVLGVWPDLRHNRPRIFVRTPYEFYPVAYDEDGLELQKAVWVEHMSGYDIMAQYGVKDYIEMDDVEVLFYMDEEEFCTVLNGEKWAHTPVKNLMGLVPLVCIGSLGVPGMIFGSTEFKDAIPVAKQINYHIALVDKMANAMVEPTIFIADPLSVPDDLAIGKGGVATAGKDGRVELLGPIQLPSGFWTLGEILNNWFDLIADNPAVLRAQGQGSIITGKGFNAQLGPVAARLQTKLDIIMGAWKRTIKYMLLMWANFPDMQVKQKVTGQKNKEYYYFEAKPQDFMLNGEMWTELEVSVNAQSYIDKQSDRVGLIQLYQTELLDWDTVASQLDEITDRGRVRRNIDKDRQWKARGIALAQQLAQSPATGNVNPGIQEATNYALERGGMGEAIEQAAPEAEAAGGPPTENPEAGMPLAAPHQNILDIIQEFFSGIGKLRGAAWWGGDPIKMPAKLATDDFQITVWVTDGQDQGTITRAAAKIPEIYGHIRFIQGQPGPEENAVQFSQGSGTPPPESPEATQPTGINPALDRMLGGV